MRGQEEEVEFDGVTVLEERGKTFRCRFEDGRERFVAKSHTIEPDEREMEASIGGDPIRLVVTAWIAGKWEEEDGEERANAVRVSGVVVLRESDKGLQVRLPGQERGEWLPKKGVHPDSPVQHDGDDGDLLLYRWCAESKGIGVKPPERDVGKDARQTSFDPDDDLPF